MEGFSTSTWGTMLAPLTEENIRESLSVVKIKDLKSWAKQAIGQTLQSARKTLLGLGSRSATKTQ